MNRCANIVYNDIKYNIIYVDIEKECKRWYYGNGGGRYVHIC